MSAEPEPPARPRLGRRHLTLLIVPILAMVVASYIADALWPDLVTSNPLLLIGLSAKNRYLVLVVNHVSTLWFFVVGTLRLLLPDPFFFALGWFYGEAALTWKPDTGTYNVSRDQIWSKLNSLP